MCVVRGTKCIITKFCTKCIITKIVYLDLSAIPSLSKNKNRECDFNVT